MANNFVKKLSTSALVLACLAGCSNGGNKNSTNTLNLDIWSVSSGEKIFRDQPSSVYSAIRGDARIDINAFRGEHEGKQLIITPSEKVSCFDADVSDLKTSSGDVISKDKVTIYAEKYISLNTIYDTVSTSPIGRCPDGLVPIKASKNRNDNAIKEGQNQGLYIDVEVSTDTKPGTYEGIITLDVDGKIEQIPMKVVVSDVLVNEESHSMSTFLDHWQFWNGEMDSSESMYDKYHYMLGEYRLSPMYAIIESELDLTDAGIERYVNKCYDLFTNSKINTIAVPYGTTTTSGQVSFDEEVMKRVIKKFYEKSVETNFNLIKRLKVYFGFADEPFEFGLMERIKVIGQRFKVCVAESVETLDDYLTDSPIHDELIDSVRNLRNVITTQYQEKYDEYIDTYCPKVRFYDTAEQRANYDSQKERWWYTCVDPRMPYPSYHTEDTLSSARLLAWMQSNYDVTGNLFWSVNVYAQQYSNAYMPIEDYYTGDAARYNGCNGDGYLMYPGKQYGVDGPLPSLRLQAIRDGYEEYELFYNLKEKAKSLGLNDKAVFDMTASSLYDGTKITGGSKNVEVARQTLGELTMAMNNGSDFVVNKCDIDEVNGKILFEFYAKNGSQIKLNGQEVSPSSSKSEGNIFTCEVPCFKDNNDIEIEVSFGDKKNVIHSHVVGKVINCDVNDLKNSFEKYNSSVTPTVTNLDGIGEVLKLEIGKPRNSKQSFKFVPSFLNKINSDTGRISLSIYNPYETNLEFSFGWRNNTNAYDTYLVENMSLTPGLNNVSLSTLYLRLGDTSNIKYFFMVLGNSSSKNEDAKEIYIKNVAVYNK